MDKINLITQSIAYLEDLKALNQRLLVVSESNTDNMIIEHRISNLTDCINYLNDLIENKQSFIDNMHETLYEERVDKLFKYIARLNLNEKVIDDIEHLIVKEVISSEKDVDKYIIKKIQKVIKSSCKKN